MAEPNWAEKGEAVSVTDRTEGAFLGMGGTKVSRVTFANGETWDVYEDDNKPSQMVNYDASLGTKFRAEQKGTTPTFREDANGDLRMWDPSINDGQGGFVPAPGMPAQSSRPGEGNYRVGNTEYRYNEQGQPEPIYSYPTTAAARAPLYPWEEESAQLDLQKKRFDVTGEGTPWQQANLAQKQQQDVMARQRQMQEDAWARANDISDTRMKAAPMAQIPGQEYFLGYEPGGIWSKVAQMQGANYDPERFRVPIVNINPQDEYEKQLAWQRANGG